MGRVRYSVEDVPGAIAVQVTAIGQTAAMVLLTLCAAGDARGRVTMSMCEVGMMLGCSARTVMRAVARLRQRGIVTQTHRGGGRGRMSEYQICLR